MFLPLVDVGILATEEDVAAEVVIALALEDPPLGVEDCAEARLPSARSNMPVIVSIVVAEIEKGKREAAETSWSGGSPRIRSP